MKKVNTNERNQILLFGVELQGFYRKIMAIQSPHCLEMNLLPHRQQYQKMSEFSMALNPINYSRDTAL